MEPNYESYIQGWRARRAQEDAATRARTEAALALLPAAAKLLRSDYGATRVGAFGSLVNSQLVPESDIDLYVDRIACGSYWQAVARLAQLFGRPVDLIELDVAPPSLLATIAEDGRDVP